MMVLPPTQDTYRCYFCSTSYRGRRDWLCAWKPVVALPDRRRCYAFKPADGTRYVKFECHNHTA